jgi:hypothetical protein
MPCREETEGHIPAKRRIPTPPYSGVHEAASKLLDHTSYKYILSLATEVTGSACNVYRR